MTGRRAGGVAALVVGVVVILGAPGARGDDAGRIHQGRLAFNALRMAHIAVACISASSSVRLVRVP